MHIECTSIKHTANLHAVYRQAVLHESCMRVHSCRLQAFVDLLAAQPSFLLTCRWASQSSCFTRVSACKEDQHSAVCLLCVGSADWLHLRLSTSVCGEPSCMSLKVPYSQALLNMISACYAVATLLAMLLDAPPAHQHSSTIVFSHHHTKPVHQTSPSPAVLIGTGESCGV